MRKPDVLQGAVYAGLLAFLYYSTWSWLVQDWNRPDYSYCYLVPIIIGFLIWDKRRQFGSAAARASWYGLLIVLAGVAAYFLGELGGELFSIYLSLWLIVLGLFWTHLGWTKLKIILFPLLFGLALFPLPHFLHNRLLLNLKLVSSQIGVALMQMVGMAAYRQGNVIDIGFTKLQVVDACSGLRYLFPLLIAGLVVAYRFRAVWWKKAVIVLSAIPLAVVTNSLRIAITGFLYENWNPRVAEGFFHGFSGWLIFMFGFGVLLLEMKVLSKIGGGRRNAEGEHDKSDGFDSSDFYKKKAKQKLVNDAQPIQPAAPKGWRLFWTPPQFSVAVLLLSATLALAQGVEFREKVPMSRSLAEFPLQVGEWSGKRDVMEQKFIEALDLNDYIIVDYQDEKTGKIVNFYAAYYDSQRKGESIHSPETCLPGGGWEFRNAGRTTVPMNPSDMTINRAFIVQGAAKQLTYFWFPSRGRILTSAYQLKLYNFWDALTRQRTDGALVRLVTPLYENEEIEDADKRLQAFARAIVPTLDGFLPN